MSKKGCLYSLIGLLLIGGLYVLSAKMAHAADYTQLDFIDGGESSNTTYMGFWRIYNSDGFISYDHDWSGISVHLPINSLNAPTDVLLGVLSSASTTPASGDLGAYCYAASVYTTLPLTDCASNFVNAGMELPGANATSTHIISVTPIDETILPSISSTTEVGINYYVSSSDASKFSDGIFGIGAGSINQNIQIRPLHKTGTSCIVLNNTADPFLNFGTHIATTTLLDKLQACGIYKENEDYEMNSGASGGNYQTIFGFIFNISTTTYFTIGTTTAGGNVRAAVASTSKSAGEVAYDQVNASCNPFSGGWDIGLCIYSIIEPPSDILSLDLDNLYNAYARVAPIGYVTRFVEILTSDATSTIPAISYSFASSSPMAVMGDIHFDPAAEIAASGDLIGQMTSDRADHKTVWDIMMPFVRLFVYLFLLFMIIHDLTGIHSGSSPSDGGGRGRMRSDIDAERESEILNWNRE